MRATSSGGSQADNVAAILAMRGAPSRAGPEYVRFIVNRCEADPERFVLYEQDIHEDSFQARRDCRYVCAKRDYPAIGGGAVMEVFWKAMIRQSPSTLSIT
jgi:hypothetical protein